MKEKIKKYGKYAGLILILTIILISIYKTTKKEVEEISMIEPLIEQPKIEQQEQIKEEVKKIKVDIKGEVKKPGVYELYEGDRVSDAINKSEGLTEQADTTLINLSKSLKDEMVIVIYNKNEIEKLKKDLTTTKTVIEYIEKECSCPDTINDACINESITGNEKTTDNIEKNNLEIQKNNKISINTATIEELQTLPGIGKSKAEEIIKYRKDIGEFKTIEEITKVSGIGENTFEKIKDNITI